MICTAGQAPQDSPRPPKPSQHEHDPGDSLRPKWPKVIGSASIAIALIGLLFEVAYALFPFVEGQLTDLEETPLPPFFRHGPPTILLRALLFITSVLLATAGGATLKRLRIGRRLHLAYAFLAMLGVIILSVHAWRMHGLTMQWIAEHPDNTVAQQYSEFVSSGAGVFASLAALCVLLAWPVFCTVWFSVLKREPDA